MLSICQLLILVAFAPVGSSYIALKHAAYLSSSAITGLVAFASCCSVILAWLLQLRLYPAAFGLTRFRFFAPAIHDWFGILLLLTFCMVAVSFVLPVTLLSMEMVRLALVLFVLVSRIPFLISDRLAGKLMLVPLDMPWSLFAFLYFPFAF